MNAWTLRWQERELRFGAQILSLTPMEFALLSVLEQAHGELVGYARLSEQAWGNLHLGDGAHVHATLKRLRRKLAGCAAPVRVEAVRGVGLRLVSRT